LQLCTAVKLSTVSDPIVVRVDAHEDAEAFGAVKTAVGSEVNSPAKRAYVSHREICGRLGRPSFASIRKYLFYLCRLRGVNFRRGVILRKPIWVI
jgi:ribosomal protein S14